MKNQQGFTTANFITAVFLAVALVVGIWSIASWKKVPAGNVGVHVYLLGGEKGVDAKVEGVGRVWVGWQQELYLYPTFTQNVKWTATDAEKGDISFRFSDVDGTPISADIGISYHVDASKAATLFQTYRKGIEEITTGVLHQRVADALNDEASQLKVDQIYGRGREALLDRAQKRVQAMVGPSGIVVEKLSWIGPPRLPKIVQDSLNSKIQATQIAAQRENEVQATIAEAAKAREKARGIADATLLQATAEAQAIQIRGEALRNNQELVQLTLAERWNGVMPAQLIEGSEGRNVILQMMHK
jgi:regulator of protease activity HflC (stomatin/prohibitin superfamily)